MKNKLFPLALFAFVLATSLVVSTATVPVASASGWRTKYLNISVAAEAEYDSIQLSSTRRYQIWRRQLIIDSDPEIILTITVKYPPGEYVDLPFKGTVLSFTFQQGDLCFTGWKGTMTAEYADGDGGDSFNIVDEWIGVDSYDIWGSGVGSYGPGSRFGDAFVKGRIHIDDFWGGLDFVVDDGEMDWVELSLQATVRYFVP